MHRDEIYAGQVLWMRHPKSGTKELVWVSRVNPKNIKAVAENGTTWTVHPSFLSLADTEDADRFCIQPPGHQLTLGAVVRFAEGSFYARKYAQYRDLVVIAHKGDGNWALAPLGGDNGKHFRGVPGNALVVQPVTVVE